MSDAKDNEKQPAASCDGGSPSSSPSDCLDLTLSDAEEDGASAPSSTTKAGNLTIFGKYAKSLRKRNNPPIGKEDGENIPLVSPPPKCKKTKKSSDIVDCNGTEVGDVGYQFHKTFNVGEGKTETTAIFHGEVIHVRDLNGASSK